MKQRSKPYGEFKSLCLLRTITQCALAAGQADSIELMETKTHGREKGSVSLNSIIATDFLKRYGELHEMPCPMGRASTDE